MTLKTAVKIVEDLQEWRTEDARTPVQDPAVITEALECLLSIAKDVLANHDANQ